MAVVDDLVLSQEDQAQIHSSKRPIAQSAVVPWIMRTTIHIFVPSFVKIRKAELTKNQRMVFTTKMICRPFLQGPRSYLAENFKRSFFFPLAIFLPSFVQIRPCSSRGYTRKSLPEPMQYWRESYIGLSTRSRRYYKTWAGMTRHPVLPY